MAPPSFSKKDILLALLGETSAFVQLDGRREGVELPEWLRTDPAVVLQLGYDLPVPIFDLVIDDEGIRATLSFRRTPFLCKVPWRAVYAIADGDGRSALFGDDAPPETELRRAAQDPKAAPAAAPAPQPLAAQPTPAAKAAKPPRPSHLKLVK